MIDNIKTKRLSQLNREELIYLYFTLGFSQTKIAKLLNTDSSNVSRKFKKENIIPSNKGKLISEKQFKGNINITKELLLDEYPKNSIIKLHIK